MKVGTALPTLRQTLTSARLVMYAGATWDWHALHHDAAYATEKGLERPIADGQMYGALFASQVLQLLGPGGKIGRLSFRFHSMVYVGDAIEVVGEVEGVQRDGASLQVTSSHRLMVGDRLCASGSSMTVAPA